MSTTTTAPAGALRLADAIAEELYDAWSVPERADVIAIIADEVEPLVTAAQGALDLLDNSPLVNGEVAEALRAALAKWRVG